MSDYVIGDIQGCYEELCHLLAAINFDEHQDRLWLVGDLVNRGPQSLDVLRFLKKLTVPPNIVLGNHDLHMLAVAYGAEGLRPGDTFQDILTAEDGKDLCEWLRRKKLLYYDTELNVVMCHAGIPPHWSVNKAQECSREVESILASDEHIALYQKMYGNEPSAWDDDLEGWERLRLIINYLTRMRFCDKEGRLTFDCGTTLGSQPEGFLPWFEIPNQNIGETTVVFGHWAALGGQVKEANIYALDTGCVWGRTLTALRLQDRQCFSVPSLQTTCDKSQ